MDNLGQTVLKNHKFGNSAQYFLHKYLFVLYKIVDNNLVY
jgi:hypothetical protein